LAHPTIKQDQPSAADMLDGIHKPQPFFDKLLVSRAGYRTCGFCADCSCPVYAL